SLGRLQRHNRRSDRQLYFLVHDRILRVDNELQLADAHWLVQVSGMWRGADTHADSNTKWNSDPNSDPNTDADTDADAGSKCSKQLDGDGSFVKSNQFVVDGQLRRRERL